MTEKQLEALRRYPVARSVKRFEEPMLSFQNQEIFPHDPHYRWTGDNFGPLEIPARGDTIWLDQLNLPIYQRIIDVYEDNHLRLDLGEIYINGRAERYYIAKMNYYFVIGDNHHNSADSRYWGFVPEDHLLGKAVTVWFSIEPEKSVLDGFRKERIFSPIK
jgi:signal peptidase I